MAPRPRSDRTTRIVMLYERSVAELMIEAAAQAEYPASPGDFVWHGSPSITRVKATTVKLHVKGLTANDRSRHHFHSLVNREALFTKNPDGSLSPFERPAATDQSARALLLPMQGGSGLAD